MSYKILNIIGEKYTKEAKDILAQVGKVDYLELSQKDLENKISQYDVLVLALEAVVDRKVIEKGKKLKVIAVPTTGLDHIDVDFARRKNIKILSLQGEQKLLEGITSTAELAFGLMIILLRHIVPAMDSVKKNQWQRDRFRGEELRGKTLGIVGLGRLGKMVARYAQAFDMRVIAYDPNVPSSLFRKLRCEKVSFQKLLELSDIISIHVPLAKETENMFDKKAFNRMKPTAILMNTSRGKIVNEGDLLAVLKKKKIAGYGTDVLSKEVGFGKTFAQYPLVEYARKNHNVVILPHIGGMTRQAREMTDIFIAKKIKNALKHYNATGKI